MQIPGFIRGKANKGNKVAAEFIRQYDNGDDDTPYDPEAYAKVKASMGEDGVLDDNFEDDAPRPEDFEQKKVSPEEKKVDKAVEGYAAKHGEPVTANEPDTRVNETKMFEEFDSWAGPEDYKEQALNAIKWQGNWDVADMVRREEWFGSDFDYDSMDDEKLSDKFYEMVESGEISGEDAFKALTGRMSDDDVKDYAEFYGLIDEDDSEDVSDDEISEALADYQWQITDKTTVADYARETAEKLGVDKDRVLKMIKSESPDIKDTDKMSIVAGLEDGEENNINYEDKINKAREKFVERSTITGDTKGSVHTFDEAQDILKKYGYDGYKNDYATKNASRAYQEGEFTEQEVLDYLKSELGETDEVKRYQDIAKIQAITDRINSYDADSAEGYLTTDESKLIKDLAQKHKLTADDLKKIGGNVFSDSHYGTDEFAYKEQSPEEQKESVNKELRESLKLPGDIVEDLKLSDEQYKILNEWLLKTKRM